MPPEFRFCRICRRNHDHGRKHVYTKSHQKSLVGVLQKSQAKIKDVKFFLKNPVVLSASDRSVHSHWCSFCNKEILEADSTFVCENAIRHLAGPEHSEMLQRFFKENGADLEQFRLYIISKDDLEKWERLIKLPGRGSVLPAVPHQLPSQHACAPPLSADKQAVPHQLPSQQACAPPLSADKQATAFGSGNGSFDIQGSGLATNQASYFSQGLGLQGDIHPTNGWPPSGHRDFPPANGQQPYPSRDIQPNNTSAAHALPCGTVGNVGPCDDAVAAFMLGNNSGSSSGPLSAFKHHFPSQPSTWDSHMGRNHEGSSTWEGHTDTWQSHMGVEATGRSSRWKDSAPSGRTPEFNHSSSGAVPPGRLPSMNSKAAAAQRASFPEEKGRLRTQPQTFANGGMQAAADGFQASEDLPPWLITSQTAQPSEAMRPLTEPPLIVPKKKLNPKRVGAAWSDRRRLELEQERAGKKAPESSHASWLPSFGGVWEIGRKKGQDRAKKRPKSMNASMD